jgi:hypothetical protein
MNKFSIIFGLICISIASCFYDSEEDLYISESCQTTNMSFQDDIKPIFAISCLSCHSNAANLGNVALEDHSSVLKYSNNGSLIGSVKHASGFKEMPQGAPKLDECKIDKIQAWVNSGSPNN